MSKARAAVLLATLLCAAARGPEVSGSGLFERGTGRRRRRVTWTVVDFRKFSPDYRVSSGMWQAAGLAGRVHHSRAHDYFARSRWSADEVGLRLVDFLIERFVEAGAPVALAVDGSVCSPLRVRRTTGRSGPAGGSLGS